MWKFHFPSQRPRKRRTLSMDKSPALPTTLYNSFSGLWLFSENTGRHRKAQVFRVYLYALSSPTVSYNNQVILLLLYFNYSVSFAHESFLSSRKAPWSLEHLSHQHLIWWYYQVLSTVISHCSVSELDVTSHLWLLMPRGLDSPQQVLNCLQQMIWRFLLLFYEEAWFYLLTSAFFKVCLFQWSLSQNIFALRSEFLVQGRGRCWNQRL